MGSTEIIIQFEKQKKKEKRIALHVSRKVSKYVVFVGVEQASVYGYCGMRSLYAWKQLSATLFILVLCYTSASLPGPLPQHLRCSRRSWDPSGKLSIKSFQIVLTFVGRRKVPDDTQSSSWLCPLTVPSVFAYMIRDLNAIQRYLGCFFSFFSCALNGINGRNKVWSIGRRSVQSDFLQLESVD